VSHIQLVSFPIDYSTDNSYLGYLHVALIHFKVCDLLTSSMHAYSGQLIQLISVSNEIQDQSRGCRKIFPMTPSFFFFNQFCNEMKFMEIEKEHLMPVN